VTGMKSMLSSVAIIPLPSSLIVPQPALFWHPSDLHGQAHVTRVMIHAARLVEATARADLALQLVACGFVPRLGAAVARALSFSVLELLLCSRAAKRHNARSTRVIVTTSRRVVWRNAFDRPGTMKLCPFCAEEIQDAAIVCKHCGRDLNASKPEVPAWETEAKALAMNGDTIAAIKKVREGTGVGLAEAKNMVDGWRKDPSTPSPNKSKSNGCAIGCFGVLALIGVLSAIAYVTPKDVMREAEDKKIEAFVICKQFVEKQLRAPKTAEFPSFSSAQVHPVAGTDYEVRSYVDAQNAFGAMIRNTFSCTVSPTSGDRWRLVDLKME
jgi:hypothetical protein